MLRFFQEEKKITEKKRNKWEWERHRMEQERRVGWLGWNHFVYICLNEVRFNDHWSLKLTVLCKNIPRNPLLSNAFVQSLLISSLVPHPMVWLSLSCPSSFNFHLISISYFLFIEFFFCCLFFFLSHDKRKYVIWGSSMLHSKIACIRSVGHYALIRNSGLYYGCPSISLSDIFSQRRFGRGYPDSAWMVLIPGPVVGEARSRPDGW